MQANLQSECSKGITLLRRQHIHGTDPELLLPGPLSYDAATEGSQGWLQDKAVSLRPPRHAQAEV